MEMQAIAGTYGIERGSVLAIAAGADAICVGGGLADDETVLPPARRPGRAVRDGELPEERLADAADTGTGAGPLDGRRRTEGAAAERARPQGAAPGRRRPGRRPPGPARRPARRLRARSPSRPTSPPSPRSRTSPWATRPPGASPRSWPACCPGTETGTFAGADAPARGRRPGQAAGDAPHRRRRPRRTPPPLDGRRPRHPARGPPRHDRGRDGRPPGPPRGALHIATHGAARVCGRAAAEVITGLAGITGL